MGMGPSYEQEQEFILRLGKAMIEWQTVESAAYDLFRAFLRGADEELISVTFHHIQSFQSTIRLLDRCAYFAVPDGPLRMRWEGLGNLEKNQGLRAKLNDQVAVRNRIVHFSYYTGSDGKNPTVCLGPSVFDATYAINDRWKNPQNELDIDDVVQARQDFRSLAQEIGQFRTDLLDAIVE